jgi:hypothetical protein
MSTRVHDTVGHRFQSMGIEYRCTRYDERRGFWMRVLAVHDDRPMFERAIGEECCVSERAIGRTFHRIHDGAESGPHEQPCDCYVCHERP